MMRALSLGYSPCPNDTFIFYALVHGRVPLPGCTLQERLEDVETLNGLALQGALDLTKISYHALGHLRRRPLGDDRLRDASAGGTLAARQLFETADASVQRLNDRDTRGLSAFWQTRERLFKPKNKDASNTPCQIP